MKEKIKLLFLCTGNSCRSQMAEGWTRHLKNDFFEVYSAGIETHGLNHNAVKVMSESGVDISHHKSQHIDEFKEISLDYVISVCRHAHDTCPVFIDQCKVIHVGFDDPPNMARILEEQGANEDQQLNCYRQVRDRIKKFVLSLPESLNQ